MTAPVPTPGAVYRDPTRPVGERVADLLSRMTLDEKIAETACPYPGFGKPPPAPGPTGGLGGATFVIAASGEPPREGAAVINRLQQSLVERTRLGIPTLPNEEALCGLKVRGATVFADGLGQAATWDPPLIEEMARAIGEDMRVLGVRQAFAPLCDVARDPRWGRVSETYGEDPYLVGSIATAFVRGLQGDDSQPTAVATLKHFIGYPAGDGGRNLHPAQIGARELREQYAVPFEMAIRLGGARSVMCSYNQVDRVPVQCAPELLTDLLRYELGFDGFVISDLRSVERLHTSDGIAPDLEHAAALAFAAGLDLELAFDPSTDAIQAALRSGLLDEAAIERAAGNVLRQKFTLGLFERPYVNEADVPDVLDSPARRDLARRVAERSLVLLRNEPVNTGGDKQLGGRSLLPLQPDVRSIAVIGPNADREFALLGGYSYPVLDTAARRVRAVMDPTQRRTAADAPPPPLISDDVVSLVESVPVVSVLEGIRARAGTAIEVSHHRGCPVEVADATEIPAAAAAATAADVAVVVVGDQPGIAQGGTVGEHLDSAECALPGVQRQLVEAVAATGTPTVVVLTHGRAFVLGWMTACVPAVLSAWFPGEEGGHAIAAALFGDVAPGGRVPISFPEHSGLLPAPYNRTCTEPGSYYDRHLRPVFPFGHGLSYTTFEYSALRLSSRAVPTDGTVRVACTVTNTGERSGDEVVQLYTHDPYARTARPRRELKGFCRITLQPGASAEVAFELAAARFALFDSRLGWLVEPGLIEIMIGSSSEDIRLRDEIRLTGEDVRLGPDRTLATPTTATLLASPLGKV